MGADLYIDKDQRSHHQGNLEDYHGYFRDSYNESNILWKLDLAYWHLDKQIPIGEIKEGKLTVEQAKILLKEVESRKPKLEEFLSTLNEEWLKKNNFGQPVIEDWKGYFSKKYEELVRFLKHAIELDSPITWSV